MKNQKFVREYERLRPEYDLISDLITLRSEQNISQAELAEKIGTQQSSISRLENLSSKPSLSFLERIAAALDARLVIRMEPAI